MTTPPTPDEVTRVANKLIHVAKHNGSVNYMADLLYDGGSYLMREHAARVAAEARADALRDALREHEIGNAECYRCRLCWVPEEGEPESHAPGCLAAPKGAER